MPDVPLPPYGHFGGNGENDAWVWADRYADYLGIPHPARDVANLAFVLEAIEHFGRMPLDDFDWAYFLHDVGSIPGDMLNNILNHLTMAQNIWDALLSEVYQLDLYHLFYGPASALFMTLIGIPFEIAREAYEVISGFVGDTIDVIGGVISDIGGFFSDFGNAVGDFFSGIGDFLGDVISGLGDLIGDFIDRVGDILRGIGDAIGEIMDTIFPVVLDLDGDGVELISAVESDVVVNGERMGWVGADDGILAFDANGNGLVDGLDEISLVNLAVGAATDLEGLAGLDSNNDGVIDASDEAYGDLLVWRDLNGDGQSSADEVMTLAQAGVASISLALNGDRFDSQGNRIFNTTGFARADGSTGVAWDVGLTSVDLLEVQEASPGVAVTSTADGFSLIEVTSGEGAAVTVVGGSAGAFATGGAGDDRLELRLDGSVMVEARGGDDRVITGHAADMLSGGAGDDHLEAGRGDDLLSGGAGDDRLVGGEGADRLSGGAGQDVFVFDGLSESVSGSEDRLLDFDADEDFIDLSGLDANALLEGRQGLVWTSDAFSGSAGEARLTWDESTGVTLFELDSDGDGQADFAILIDGHVTSNDGWML